MVKCVGISRKFFEIVLSQTMVVIFVLIFLCVVLVRTTERVDDGNKDMKQFDAYDLVIVNGTWDGVKYQDAVATFIQRTNNDFSFVVIALIKVNNTSSTKTESRVGDYYYQCNKVPNSALRAFSVKKLSQSSNPSTLASLDRRDLKRAYRLHSQFVSHHYWKSNDTLDVSLWSLLNSIPNATFANAFCASVIRQCGIIGLWYLNNNWFDDEAERIFKSFYKKYLRRKPRAIVTSHCVKAGDLVKIKALKPQNSTGLQLKARHFGGSFGEITGFLSGDLARKNSRNQTEFAIQSLFDNNMTLALRPKYLCKITKIYVHRLWDDVRDHSSLKQQSFWNDARNLILYLPFFCKPDIESPIFPSNDFQSLIYAMHNQGNENVIIDPVATAAITLIDRLKQSDDLIQTVFASLSFCMDRVTWERIMRVIGNSQMKKSAKVKERDFIESIEKLFNVHHEKMQNAESKMSAKIVISGPHTMLKNGCSAQFHLEVMRKIERDLRKGHSKNIANYRKLLVEISKETKMWLSELNPDYLEHFDEYLELRQIGAIYRIAVIQNYLKANENGRDLHVIYYGDEATGVLQNLTLALSRKLNIEWNINNLNVSDLLANRIIA